MGKLNNILLIDDDAICSWINRVMLEEMQVAQTVECISDGKSAIEYLQGGCSEQSGRGKTSPDLIFLDLNMPGIDGFEVLEKLKNTQGCESLSAERIVVLTTSMHQKDLEKAKSYNVYGYLVKPLTEAKITEILHNFKEARSEARLEVRQEPQQDSQQRPEQESPTNPQDTNNNNKSADRKSADRSAAGPAHTKENKLN